MGSLFKQLPCHSFHSHISEVHSASFNPVFHASSSYDSAFQSFTDFKHSSFKRGYFISVIFFRVLNAGGKITINYLCIHEEREEKEK